MKMIKRSTLLGLTIGLAALLLIYSFLRSFTGIKLDESTERIAINCVMVAAIGIFFMNRQLAAQEKKEAAAKKEADKEIDIDESVE